MDRVVNVPPSFYKISEPRIFSNGLRFFLFFLALNNNINICKCQSKASRMIHRHVWPFLNFLLHLSGSSDLTFKHINESENSPQTVTTFTLKSVFLSVTWQYLPINDLHFEFLTSICLSKRFINIWGILWCLFFVIP